MRPKVYHAILLMFVGLILFGVQALVWQRTSHTPTETNRINSTNHRPTEIPVIAGTCLLLAAGTILAIKPNSNRNS